MSNIQIALRDGDLHDCYADSMWNTYVHTLKNNSGSVIWTNGGYNGSSWASGFIPTGFSRACCIFLGRNVYDGIGGRFHLYSDSDQYFFVEALELDGTVNHSFFIRGSRISLDPASQLSEDACYIDFTEKLALVPGSVDYPTTYDSMVVSGSGTITFSGCTQAIRIWPQNPDVGFYLKATDVYEVWDGGDALVTLDVYAEDFSFGSSDLSDQLSSTISDGPQLIVLDRPDFCTNTGEDASAIELANEAYLWVGPNSYYDGNPFRLTDGNWPNAPSSGGSSDPALNTITVCAITEGGELRSEPTSFGGYDYQLFTGSSVCRRQSDASLDDARSGNNYSTGFTSGTSTMSIFYYDYASLAIEILARDLSDMQWTTIHGLDLHLNQSNVTKQSCTVKLLESGDRDYSSIGDSDIHRVFLGTTVTNEHNIMHIEFDAPYQFTGNNLGILIEWDYNPYTSGVSLYPDITFYYKEPGGGQ